MAKKNKKDEEVIVQKEFIITGASINDEFCNYEFEIKNGVGIGDVHKVKGSGIVDEDLTRAFAVLNVHLASIDDVFKHSNIDVENIDKFHGHELTADFNVTGFKVKENDENETIILIGTKRVSSAGERMAISTPKILLDSLSSYRWYNELKLAADEVRREVELYKGGKCTPVEKKEETDPAQLTIVDELNLTDHKHE